jgi:hypothetical protein
MLSHKSPLFTGVPISSSVDLCTQLGGHRFYAAYSPYLKIPDEVLIRVGEKCIDVLRVKWTNFSPFSNSFHCHSHCTFDHQLMHLFLCSGNYPNTVATRSDSYSGVVLT